MKKYEINRMAVLVDLMSECLGSGTSVILAGLQGFCLCEQDAGDIKRVLDDMEE